MPWEALGVHLGPLEGHLGALGGPLGHHAFMWSPKGVHSVPLWPLRGVFWDHFSLNLRTHFLHFRGFVFRLIFIMFFGWCLVNFDLLLVVILAMFSDYAKTARPHASAVNSDWIEGRALQQST